MKIKRFALGQLWTNVYLVFDSKGNTVLIDPAAESKTVLAWIKQNALKLSTVLLTHGHIDHVGGLADSDLLKSVGDNIYIHSAESGMLSVPEKEFARRLGFEFDGISSFKVLEGGEHLRCGSLVAEVIHTPGHTQGSVCYLMSDEEEPGERVLFSGDTLFAGSVGRTDLAGGDTEQLEKSLLTLKELPPELEVFPGHGPSTTLHDESRKNPFWPA